MVCTILKVPVASFFSTSLHNHLPSCSCVYPKCRESHGPVHPWLRFASRWNLTSFLQKSEVLHRSSINGRNPTNYFSLGLDLHQGACSKFLSRLVHLFHYCQHHMRLEGLMAQCNKKSIHHPIAKCKCISHTTMFLWSTLLKLWFHVL
jgi:hypothetical protein